METSGLLSYSGQSRESVTASVQAGQQYSRERDIPDVLGWKDLAAQPDATFDALCRRASEGRVPGAVCGFPLPKPGKDDLRRLAHLHPLDDLQLRLLAGRILVGVTSCAHVHSFGARLASGPPGWQIEPSNHAWQCLRDVASAHIDSGRYATLVKCDIRRCYPSISAEIVERALVSQGLDAKRIGPLVELLRGLVLVGAPRGLPIGPEASALIAGLVLGVVDRDLAEAGLAHLRYSDDSFIFVCNGASTAHAYDAYCAALDSLGLEPNSEKYESLRENVGWGCWARRHQVR